jgi:transposase
MRVIQALMGLVNKDDGWRIPDVLWALIEPLLPKNGKPHPLGCHNPKKPDREAMNAVLLVLRTGMQWNALNGTGLCSSSRAHRRFLEWVEAGVFLEFWKQGLLAFDGLVGIDWEWLSMDGAMSKAPLGGEKNRAQSDRPGKEGNEAQPSHRRIRYSVRARDRRGQPKRFQDGLRDH